MNSKPVKKTAPITALTFHETVFQIVDDDAKQWLRLPQIGAALGYENPYKVQQLYERNAAEFTESMTKVIDLPTAGGVQATRVFSFRGAHLLGMLAKTERAMEFRQWALDILDGEVLPQEVGRLSPTQKLQHQKERRSLAREIAGCSERGLAEDLHDIYSDVCRSLGRRPRELEVLAPGLKQVRLSFEGGAT
jgi:prophage antirepressor-like protein